MRFGGPAGNMAGGRSEGGRGGPCAGPGGGEAVIHPPSSAWGLHRAPALCAEGRQAGAVLRDAERCWKLMNLLGFPCGIGFFFSLVGRVWV